MKRTNELLVILIFGLVGGAGCAFGGNDERPYPDSGAKADGKTASGGDGGADASGVETDGGPAADVLGQDLSSPPKVDAGLDTADWGRDSGGIINDAATEIPVGSADTSLRADVDATLVDTRLESDGSVDGPLASRLDANSDASVEGRLGDAPPWNDARADLSEDG